VSCVDIVIPGLMGISLSAVEGREHSSFERKDGIRRFCVKCAFLRISFAERSDKFHVTVHTSLDAGGKMCRCKILEAC